MMIVSIRQNTHTHTQSFSVLLPLKIAPCFYLKIFKKLLKTHVIFVRRRISGEKKVVDSTAIETVGCISNDQ